MVGSIQHRNGEVNRQKETRNTMSDIRGMANHDMIVGNKAEKALSVTAKETKERKNLRYNEMEARDGNNLNNGNKSWASDDTESGQFAVKRKRKIKET